MTAVTYITVITISCNYHSIPAYERQAPFILFFEQYFCPEAVVSFYALIIVSKSCRGSAFQPIRTQKRACYRITGSFIDISLSQLPRRCCKCRLDQYSITATDTGSSVSSSVSGQSIPYSCGCRWTDAEADSSETFTTKSTVLDPSCVCHTPATT